MENVSLSTRTTKRRRLASPQEDELETLPPSEARPGWSLTGLVGRVFMGDVKDPPAQTPGVNDKSPTTNKPTGKSNSLAGSKEQATAITTTLLNGGACVVAEKASRETGSAMEEQEEIGVTTPKSGRRGRSQGQNKTGNLARTADVGGMAATTGGRLPVGRTSRRTTRSRADPSTNGAGTSKIAGGTPARQKNVSVRSNARTTQRRELESPDLLGEPMQLSPNADSTDHGERVQPADEQSYDKAKSPKVMETEDNETAQLTNGSTLEQEASEVMDIDGTEGSPPKPRSSGRQRKRPRRYSVEVEATEGAKHRLGTAELLSILTPSKWRKGGMNRRKKSVSFQGPMVDFGEEQLGFTDIDSSKRADGDHDDSVNGYENDDGGEGALANLAESELTGSVELGIHADDILMRGGSDINGHMEDVDDLPQYARDFRKMCLDRALESQLSVLSHIILEQLTSKRRFPLLGLDDAYLKVHQVVRQTVIAGEGNSMLILGARGTGKTALVETVISDLAKDHRDDFHVIRLNGFIHTDDRLALKELWKQLGREMDTGDKIAGNPISYADTLSLLLALLSHPEELSGEETDAAAKSVIFIMDEFDLFASHPRQTLLYNLFDIAQARKAPIAVLGLSTKVDVSESLEKRVKSRFSHRYVHLPMSKNLKTFEAICKAGLEVQDTDKSRFRGSEGQMLLDGWSQLLKGLFEEDETFISFLQRLFYQTKSVQEFFAASTLPILALSADTIPTGKTFVQDALFAPESKLQMLEGLSALELSLLIAAARLNIILDQDNCNFSMVFEEYQKMVTRARIQSSASGVAAAGGGSKVWSRQLSLGAWERLGDYELITPVTGTLTLSGAGTRDVSQDGRMFKVDVALEEILPSVQGMSAVMSKWCREI